MKREPVPIRKEDALKAVDDEDELPGLMPQAMFEDCKTIEGATALMQSVVIATKQNIRNRILAL